MLIFDDIENRMENLTIPLKNEIGLIEKYIHELSKKHFKYKILKFDFIKEYYLKKIRKKISKNKNNSFYRKKETVLLASGCFYKNDIIGIKSGSISVAYHLEKFPHNISKKIFYGKKYQNFNCCISIEKSKKNSVHGDIDYTLEIYLDGFKEKYTTRIDLINNTKYTRINDHAYHQNDDKDKLCLAYIFENINQEYEDIMDCLRIQFDMCDDSNRYSDIIQSLKDFLLTPNQEDFLKRKKYNEITQIDKNY